MGQVFVRSPLLAAQYLSSYYKVDGSKDIDIFANTYIVICALDKHTNLPCYIEYL